jgi:hypothetical protein
VLRKNVSLEQGDVDLVGVVLSGLGNLVDLPVEGDTDAGLASGSALQAVVSRQDELALSIDTQLLLEPGHHVLADLQLHGPDVFGREGHLLIGPLYLDAGRQTELSVRAD